MTFEEIRQIPDLQIDVTPATEDAFHFLYGLDQKGIDLTDAQIRCGESLRQYPDEEIKVAKENAFKMIDNIRKYGVACAKWV